MSTTESGIYRIVLDEDGYLEVFNLEHGHPLTVTTDHEDYDTDISDTIADITEGNKLEATVTKTDETREDGFFDNEVWKFDAVAIDDATRTYHAFGDVPIVSAAERLLNKLAKSENAGIARSDITVDGEVIGRVIVFDREYESPAEPLFEKELRDLSEYGEPPFEVYQTATEKARYFVHYYIVDLDSDLATALRSRVDD